MDCAHRTFGRSNSGSARALCRLQPLHWLCISVSYGTSHLYIHCLCRCRAIILQCLNDAFCNDLSDLSSPNWVRVENVTDSVDGF